MARAGKVAPENARCIVCWWNPAHPQGALCDDCLSWHMSRPWWKRILGPSKPPWALGMAKR